MFIEKVAGVLGSIPFQTHSMLQQAHYNRYGVRVTENQLILRGNGYGLSSINRVLVRTQYPDRRGPVTCIVAGGLLSWAWVGIPILIAGVIWLVYQKPIYWLSLHTQMGILEPYHSHKLHIIKEVQAVVAATLAQLAGVAEGGATDSGSIANASETGESLKVKLLKIAAKRNGKLSVTQAALDTGASFEAIEQALNSLVKIGYVTVSNDPGTGIVVYDFKEL